MRRIDKISSDCNLGPIGRWLLEQILRGTLDYPPDPNDTTALVRSLYHRIQYFEERDPSGEWVEGEFTLDWLHGVSFRGFTKGDTWNGWSVPYFEHDEAQRVAEAFSSIMGDEAFYDPEYDEFHFVTQNDSTAQPYVVGPQYMEHVKVYPIGAFTWQWSQIL